MMTSFIVLSLTGLPLKFHELGLSQWWIAVWGGIEVTRSVHHFFAWVMIADCVYHLVYLGYSTVILRRPFPIAMIPMLRDVRNFYAEFAYLLGLRKARPKFDRYHWREKFDYWAIFWGVPIIGGSGFIMMYPILVTKVLPGWIVPAALIAHGDEAMLALVWIFIVHIFFNHFTPGIFPVNKSIFTGKVPEERYKHEHALEYERLMAPPSPQPPPTAPADGTKLAPPPDAP